MKCLSAPRLYQQNLLHGMTCRMQPFMPCSLSSKYKENSASQLSHQNNIQIFQGIDGSQQKISQSAGHSIEVGMCDPAYQVKVIGSHYLSSGSLACLSKYMAKFENRATLDQGSITVSVTEV